MSGTMTSARTDITQLNSRDKLSTSAERNTSKTPAAATGGAAALSGSAESNKLQNSGEQREQQAKAESEQKQREQQEAFAKEIDKMRGDLAQLRQELGAEITRREEAELESEYKDHKVQVAESRCAKAEHEKRTEELKASEMQRCLELLQEDVVKKTREVELKYLEQERRIAMQQEMYSKMHRLQNFLPPNIIQKSFLSDMNM
ncbi:unnamed protein product [Amoebophrya sp. A120]|nr:unnamed protein product [Amoebophrya sp. A120]|eukprot:GSA120T00003625001.1